MDESAVPPSSVPPLAPPSPIPPFNPAGYSQVVGEVYDVARRVRANWGRMYRALLRADGIMGVALSATILSQSSVSSSPAYPFLGLSWFLYAAALVFCVVIVAIPQSFQRRADRRWLRRGQVPSLEVGSAEPTLDASTRVFGRLQREWSELFLSMGISIVLVVVALLYVGSDLLRIVPSALAGSPLAPIWPYVVAGILLAAGVALLVWVASCWRTLRALEPAVRTVEGRFGQLEWTFWQRY